MVRLVYFLMLLPIPIAALGLWGIHSETAEIDGDWMR